MLLIDIDQIVYPSAILKIANGSDLKRRFAESISWYLPSCLGVLIGGKTESRTGIVMTPCGKSLETTIIIFHGESTELLALPLVEAKSDHTMYRGCFSPNK